MILVSNMWHMINSYVFNGRIRYRGMNDNENIGHAINFDSVILCF